NCRDIRYPGPMRFLRRIVFGEDGRDYPTRHRSSIPQSLLALRVTSITYLPNWILLHIFCRAWVILWHPLNFFLYFVCYGRSFKISPAAYRIVQLASVFGGVGALSTDKGPGRF